MDIFQVAQRIRVTVYRLAEAQLTASVTGGAREETAH